MLALQYDCIPDSPSYNETVCDIFSKKCPSFCKSDPNDEDCSVELQRQGVSCDERLMGQCIILNRYGTLKQTLNDPGMFFKHRMSKTELPLWVFAKPQGQVELMPTPGIEMKWTKINERGSYHFSVEDMKIKRLPYPYNKNKPCVKESSSVATLNNMFKGGYTMGKCLGTCWMRAQLKYCGAASSVLRVQVLDQAVLKSQLRNKSSEELHECVHEYHDNIYDDLNACALECPTPCDGESFTMAVRYEPSKKEDAENVQLFFYYMEMTEKMIEEAPSYVYTTLFGNFGGTLGLMTGMSVISVIEMSIWFIMFIIDRCYSCRQHVEK